MKMPAEDDNSSGNQPTIRRRKTRSLRRRDGLVRFADDNTSQNGEDGIIARIFECLPESDQRYVVDVGAWDGVHLSNTHSLLCGNQNCSWTGLLIEASAQKFLELQKKYASTTNRCLNAAVSISQTSLNQLASLLETNASDFPLDFDFLCIDIDGVDYWVLEGLLSTTLYRPKVVCIEFNPTMPNDLIFIPVKSDNTRQGASLAALVELANQWDYVLVETTLFNAFFVPRSLYEIHLKEEVPDTSIEALHEVTMGTSLYQLYDGNLKVWGCRKMLWHRIAIDEKKLQMISEDKRQFPFAPSSSDSFDMTHAVNMSAICDDATALSNTEKQQCADDLLKKLSRNGFAYVRGIGVTRDLCQDALHVTKALLTDADESVRRACLTYDRARRGYSPTCTENFASLIGESGPNDLVRKFRIGPVNDAGASSSLLQPNVWPTGEVWDASTALSFQTKVEEYYVAICRAADCIVRAICDAMQRQQPDLRQPLQALSSGDPLFHTSILTLLGYKIGTRHKGKKKSPLVAAHTDVGVITILMFDGPGCAQLQRSDHAGGWVDVSLPPVVPEDPVFVVNIGDCMSELTNKALPSTLHRVVADLKHKDARHCLALFVGLDPQTQLTIGGDSMSFEEWRKRRIARAQKVLQARSSPS